jgi:hypothetical protein
VDSADGAAVRIAMTKTEDRRSADAQGKDHPRTGLVSVLKTLHDELDAAVLDAYGWSDLTASLADPATREAAAETLLVRLVALNAERAAEEAKGHIRWLRPEYQHPSRHSATGRPARSRRQRSRRSQRPRRRPCHPPALAGHAPRTGRRRRPRLG